MSCQGNIPTVKHRINLSLEITVLVIGNLIRKVIRKRVPALQPLFKTDPIKMYLAGWCYMSGRDVIQ